MHIAQHRQGGHTTPKFIIAQGPCQTFTQLCEKLFYLTAEKHFAVMHWWPRRTLLHAACSSGNVELVDFLLAKGAAKQVNDADEDVSSYFCLHCYIKMHSLSAHLGHVPLMQHLA